MDDLLERVRTAREQYVETHLELVGRPPPRVDLDRADSQSWVQTTLASPST